MRILVVGAGVIGTVYGAHLGAAGHEIAVLARGPRTVTIAREGLNARDLMTNADTRSPAIVLERSDAARFDLVLVAVRRDQLAAAGSRLVHLSGLPLVLVFGNNPEGRAGVPDEIPGTVRLGFPGVGGTIRADVAEYVRIRQQPTALEAAPDPRLDAIKATLRERGLVVQEVSDMPGWLAYHAVFIASVTAALYRCQADPRRLADDRGTLDLMCRAITEGFGDLHARGVGGLPRNLAILHHPLLRPVAVRYWAHTMRSEMGELAFAAHARHAQPEMRALAHDVLASASDQTRSGPLEQLLR